MFCRRDTRWEKLPLCHCFRMADDPPGVSYPSFTGNEERSISAFEIGTAFRYRVRIDLEADPSFAAF
jgi:hypothetical protein